MSSHRQDAVEIVKRLRETGYVAYFAGGCVRDELLGRTPSDYDVATSATPEMVQALFSHTIPVGAQFGVIIVMTEDRQTEVATFRTDGLYIDGRRPESVRFATAEEDAQRRDFTINGLFLDPLTGDVFDYVGGREDIKRGIIRAIGAPGARFAEDKLRMLRAVRFATTLKFGIEEGTWIAVRQMAPCILEVSWERIRDEMGKILMSGSARFGFKLLHESWLMDYTLPEIIAMKGVEQQADWHPEGDVFTHTMLMLEHLDRQPDRSEVLAWAALLHDVGKPATQTVEDGRIKFNGHAEVGAEMADVILRRFRHPTEVIVEVVELVKQHMAFTQIREWRGAKVRRFLMSPLAARQMELHHLDCLAGSGNIEALSWCEDKLYEFSKEPPRPPKLVGGDDLLAMGYPVGPTIGRLIRLVDDERLEGRLSTKEEALAWLVREHSV